MFLTTIKLKAEGESEVVEEERGQDPLNMLNQREVADAVLHIRLRLTRGTIDTLGESQVGGHHVICARCFTHQEQGEGVGEVFLIRPGDRATRRAST